MSVDKLPTSISEIPQFDHMTLDNKFSLAKSNLQGLNFDLSLELYEHCLKIKIIQCENNELHKDLIEQYLAYADAVLQKLQNSTDLFTDAVQENFEDETDEEALESKNNTINSANLVNPDSHLSNTANINIIKTKNCKNDDDETNSTTENNTGKQDECEFEDLIEMSFEFYEISKVILNKHYQTTNMPQYYNKLYEVQIGLGQLAQTKENFDESISEQNKAIDILEKQGKVNSRAGSEVNYLMAITYMNRNQGYEDKALINLSKCRQILESILLNTERTGEEKINTDLLLYKEADIYEHKEIKEILTDLYEKIEECKENIGKQDQIKDKVRGALSDVINSTSNTTNSNVNSTNNVSSSTGFTQKQANDVNVIDLGKIGGNKKLNNVNGINITYKNNDSQKRKVENGLNQTHTNNIDHPVKKFKSEHDSNE